MEISNKALIKWGIPICGQFYMVNIKRAVERLITTQVWITRKRSPKKLLCFISILTNFTVWVGLARPVSYPQ